MQLQAKNLCLSAGSKLLLQDFSVTISAGQSWVVLGGNGSGKTTLLHTLAGLHRPDRGTVLLDDKDLHTMSHRDRARQIGILFQDQQTLFPGTVLESVLASRYPYSGWSQLLQDSSTDFQIATAALADLGLQNLAKRSMTSLSGGERRRVQLAALLAQSTPIRLLDEPANHLDLRHQAELFRLFGKANENSTTPDSNNKLDVIVLHDINQALDCGSHAILLYGDGAGVAGPINDIVTRCNLEELYQCELRELPTPSRSYYFPK